VLEAEVDSRLYLALRKPLFVLCGSERMRWERERGGEKRRRGVKRKRSRTNNARSREKLSLVYHSVEARRESTRTGSGEEARRKKTRKLTPRGKSDFLPPKLFLHLPRR
jgi:hypothetical protein